MRRGEERLSDLREIPSKRAKGFFVATDMFDGAQLIFSQW